MSGGGESVWVDCEACEGHGWVKPAPADPFMPSPEVRAALALLIDAGNLMGAARGEHFRTAARTVHAWLYGAAQ